MILNAMKPRGDVTENKNALPEKEACDKCGRQPYVKAKKGKSVLMFCLHHGRDAVPALVEEDWEIEDNTHLLVKDSRRPTGETPPSASNTKDDGGSGVLARMA